MYLERNGPYEKRSSYNKIHKMSITVVHYFKKNWVKEIVKIHSKKKYSVYRTTWIRSITGVWYLTIPTLACVKPF